MKKSIFILIIGLYLLSYPPAGNAAIQIVETGPEVEVTEHAPKMFIYSALRPWLDQDASDLYFKKYQAKKSVKMEGPIPENIRVWIKDIKSGDRKYTHIITIALPYEKVIVDDKKQIKAVDRFTYAVDAHQIAFCPNSEPNNSKSIKLIHSYHKVIP